MNKKHVKWVLFGLTAVMAGLLLPPLPKSKARSTRIQSVNHIAGLSFTMPGTSEVPTAAKAK